MPRRQSKFLFACARLTRETTNRNPKTDSTLRFRPLAERGLDLSYETVRRWVCKFGPLFARDLRRRRPRPTARWHLDEMLNTIAGKRHWLWRAVDDEGEVLDVLGRRDGTPGQPSGSCVNSLESTALRPR